jgi:hypothetical protein
VSERNDDWSQLDGERAISGDDDWVHFDEYEDAVLSIEIVRTGLERVHHQPTQWKWVIIGMQNALQGAMVVALSGTDGCGALDFKSQKKNREWFNQMTAARPRRQMANYNELLQRVQRPELLDGPIPQWSADDKRNLERLNEVRRQFAHYNPTSWGIHIPYLINVMPAALHTFEHLLTTGGRSSIHFNAEQMLRMNNGLRGARGEIELLKLKLLTALKTAPD